MLHSFAIALLAQVIVDFSCDAWAYPFKGTHSLAGPIDWTTFGTLSGPEQEQWIVRQHNNDCIADGIVSAETKNACFGHLHCFSRARLWSNRIGFVPYETIKPHLLLQLVCAHINDDIFSFIWAAWRRGCWTRHLPQAVLPGELSGSLFCVRVSTKQIGLRQCRAFGNRPGYFQGNV